MTTIFDSSSSKEDSSDFSPDDLRCEDKLARYFCFFNHSEKMTPRIYGGKWSFSFSVTHS